MFLIQTKIKLNIKNPVIKVEVLWVKSKCKESKKFKGRLHKMVIIRIIGLLRNLQTIIIININNHLVTMNMETKEVGATIMKIITMTTMDNLVTMGETTIIGRKVDNIRTSI